MEIILASQSPRRRELMGFFPFPITVRVSQADEKMDPAKLPEVEVARISRNKAEAVARACLRRAEKRTDAPRLGRGSTLIFLSRIKAYFLDAFAYALARASV